MSKPKTYSELARAMTREQILQHQRYHEQREKCREMEAEMIEAIALLIEQQSNVCDIPPAGWWCSRDRGHAGPCAARPTTASVDNAAIEGDLWSSAPDFNGKSR